jgi:tRNA threonylcarbamoyl adenosine modification protein YjeE
MTSTSETHTLEIARLVWEQVKENLGNKAIIFALKGPLGAGKTRFAKGIALALGIFDNIVSPTYVLETEYNMPRSEVKFIHIDAYRLETEAELTRLGFARRIRDKSVIVIEWADKFPTFLNQFAGNVTIVSVTMSSATKKSDREIVWEII